MWWRSGGSSTVPGKNRSSLVRSAVAGPAAQRDRHPQRVLPPAARASSSALASACSCRALSRSTCRMTSVPSPSSSSPRARTSQSWPVASAASSTLNAPGRVAALVHGTEQRPACPTPRSPSSASHSPRRRPSPPGWQPRSQSAAGADQAGQEHAAPAALASARAGRGLLDQLDVHDAAGGAASAARDRHGSTSGPWRRWAARPSPRRAAGWPAPRWRGRAARPGRRGRAPAGRGRSSSPRRCRAPARSRRCAGRPAGTPAAARSSRALLSASRAWVIWSAVVLASAISSGSASLRQQVRSTAPTVLPGDRVVDRHPGAGQVLQVLGVVLVPEHVRGLAALQRGADPVGADELLGVAEARARAGPRPGAARGRGPPVSRLSTTPAASVRMMLIGWPSRCSRRLPQHRHGAAGQRGVQIGVADVGQLDAVGGDVPLPGPPPGRQDRLAHLARVDGLGASGTAPGPRPARSLSARAASARRGHHMRLPCLPVPALEPVSPRARACRVRVVRMYHDKPRALPDLCLKLRPPPPT